MENVTMGTKECPSCGAEIKPSYSKEWLLLMEGSIDKKELICPQCGASLNNGKDANDNELQTDETTVTKRNRKRTIKFWVILLSLTTLMLFLNTTFDVLNWKDDKGHILYVFVWLLIVSALLSAGKKLKKQIQYASIWLGLILTLLAGYSYRGELLQIKNRILSNLLPEYGTAEKQGSMSFTIASDGHYHIRASVGGVSVRFLVDTGASYIVLSPKAAEKLGYDLDKISYDRYYETANGYVRGSSIELQDFKLGSLHLENVSASINEAQMSESLLGMSFFNKLASYKVEDGVLTLYWER